MQKDKIDFLKHKTVPLLTQLSTDTLPVWGTMTLQQMIEHLADAIRLSSGRFAHTKLITPEEKIPRMQAFLMGDQPFPQGTPNPFLNEGSPAPLKSSSVETAINEVQSEMDHYFSVIESSDQFEILHPYFGRLNNEMNLQQLYKHVVHHLTQFGVAF